MAGHFLPAALLLITPLLWAGGGKEQASPPGGTDRSGAGTTASSAPARQPQPTTPSAPAREGQPSLAPAEVERRIGAMIYLDGGVEVTRDGKRLDPAGVAIGMDVENFDYVSTQSDGTAEMEITVVVSPGTTLRVDPNTTFYLEVTRVGQAVTSTEFTVLRGALGFKVKKITGNQEVVIRTDNAVLGVRGTEFRVITSPAGDALVSCREGDVEVRDEAGAANARPGTVVEKLGATPFRSIAVQPAALDGFESAWYAERIDALRANALRATRSFAERYERSAGAFRSAFLALVSDHGEVIGTWVREDREGRVGAVAEQMSEKKQIIGALFRVQRELYVLERLYERLLELSGYHEEGVGRGEIRPGLTTQQFFERFEAEREEIAQNLRYVRYTTKLYARRNGGVFPSVPAGAVQDEDADSFFASGGDFESDED